jgi:ubiquitin C-terminal hydrolase
MATSPSRGSADGPLTPFEEAKAAGNTAFSRSQYVVALKKYDECLSLLGVSSSTPADSLDDATAKKAAVIFHNIGRVLLNQGQQFYARATKHFDDAIRLDPSYAKAHEGKGKVLQAERSYLPALAAYKSAKRHDPELKNIDETIAQCAAEYRQYLASLKGDAAPPPPLQSDAPKGSREASKAVAAAAAAARPAPVQLTPSLTAAPAQPAILRDRRWQRMEVARGLAQYDARGLVPGDRYAVIPLLWWQQWCAFVGGFDHRKDVAAWVRVLQKNNTLHLPPTDNSVIKEYTAVGIQGALPVRKQRSENNDANGNNNGNSGKEAEGEGDGAAGIGAAYLYEDESGWETTASVSHFVPPGPIDTRGLLASKAPADQNAAVSDGLVGPRLAPSLRVDVEVALIGDVVFELLHAMYGTTGPKIYRYSLPVPSENDDDEDITNSGNRKQESIVDLYPELHRFERKEKGYENGNASKGNGGNGAASDSDDEDDEAPDADSSGPQSGGGGSSAAARVCVNCGAAATTSRCGACRVLNYCSRECQLSHWDREHKQQCQQFKALAAENKIVLAADGRRAVLKQALLNGRVGLVNLGNTCFMNSSLQALAAVWPLTQYFLLHQYKNEINVTNVLGTKGKLATAYASLIEALWLSKQGVGSVTPSELKRAMGRFQERFNGYEQHDAQELMNYLLDGLHEDLNRVLKKEYVEEEEGKGRPDAIVAQLSWEKFLIRNRSVIVDNFAGQLKSTVVCPECKHVSVKFDPYTMVQVPLPTQGTRFVEVYLQRLAYDPADPATWELPNGQAFALPIAPPSGRRLEHYMFRLPKSAQMPQLKIALSKASGIPADRFSILTMDHQSQELDDLYNDTLNLTTLRQNFRIVISETVPPKWQQKQATVPYDLSQAFALAEAKRAAPHLHPLARLVVIVDLLVARHATPEDPLPPAVTHAQLEASSVSAMPLVLTCSRSTTVSQFRMLLARQLYHAIGPNLIKHYRSEENADTPLSEHDALRIIASNLLIFDPVPNRALSSLSSERDSVVPTFDESLGSDADPSRPANTAPLLQYVKRAGSFADGGLPITEPYQMNWAKVHVHLRGPRIHPYVDRTALCSIFDTPSFVAMSAEAERIAKRETEGASLDDCFERFVLPETLDEQNMWYCPSCKEFRQANKTLEIWSLPDTLILHLKRFE